MFLDLLFIEVLYHHQKDDVFRTRPAHRVVFLLNGAPLQDGEDRLPKNLREALTQSLRILVDQWLGSGRHANGVEDPLSRSVYWRPVLKPLATRLIDVLRAWNKRHAPDLAILPSGERQITMGKPKEHDEDDWASQLFSLGYNPPPPKNEWEAQETAIYWLQELLDSPDRYRIARCNNPECGRYYLRERTPAPTIAGQPRLIKRGTYCRDCANAGSVVRVKASREQRRQALIECAVDVWDRFKPSPHYGRKSDWVAMKVSKKLRLEMPIKGKWITQNQAAIEAEVERRKHGTV